MAEPVPEGFPDRIARTKDDRIKEAMHEMPYGIYIIGASQGGRPNGMIADWVMQVSFDPRLVAVAFEQDSTTLAAVRENGAFTVNLLKVEDNGMALAAGFVQPRRGEKIRGRSEEAAHREYDKLAGVDYMLTLRGCPVLEDALAWLDCDAEQFVTTGDHTLVIGRVLDGEVITSGEPLTSTYTGWTYSG